VEDQAVRRIKDQRTRQLTTEQR